MKLNCKQGDLAVIIKSYKGNEGKIVQCLEYYYGFWISFNGDIVGPEPGWRTDTKFEFVNENTTSFVLDRFLKPIRDNDGEDETIQWAGKPVEVEELVKT